MIPVDRISSFQQTAMFVTGITWARYSLVITPINYGLCSANAVMASIAAIQLGRKISAGQLLE